MEYQKALLDIVSKYVPEDEKLVDFISKLIHLGKEASYRRMRCEVEFSLSEVVTIAKKLNINLTSLIMSGGGDSVTCNLRVLDETTSIHSYIKKLNADISVFDCFGRNADTSLYSINTTLPDLFYFPYTYLTKLQLLKIQFRKEETIQPLPLEQMDVPAGLAKVQETYFEKLKSFNHVLILDPNLLTSVINDIQFFYKLNLITEQEKEQLKTELFSILDAINVTATTGAYNGQKIYFYVSHISLDFSYALILSKEVEASIINLHYPNSLVSFDEKMSHSNLDRLYMIKKCSTLITQTGELSKIEFLNRQKEKLRRL